MPNFSTNVETLCKTPRKTQRFSRVNFCGYFYSSTPNVQISHFFTYFSIFPHQLFHKPLTPISHQFFPHFHIAYNYNYNIFK